MATFADDFERADNPTDLGANWTWQRDNTHQSMIAGGTAEPTIKQAATLMAVVSTTLTPTDAQFAEAIIHTLSGTADPLVWSSISTLCRCAAPGTRDYYRFLAQSSSAPVTADLQVTTAGAGTSLGTANPAWASTDPLRGECSSDQITLLRNGSAIIGPVTDSTFSSGFVGLANYVNDATNNLADSRIASFNGGDLAAAATAIYGDNFQTYAQFQRMAS